MPMPSVQGNSIILKSFSIVHPTGAYARLLGGPLCLFSERHSLVCFHVGFIGP